MCVDENVGVLVDKETPALALMESCYKDNYPEHCALQRKKPSSSPALSEI